MTQALPKPKYPAARIGMPGEQAYTASEVRALLADRDRLAAALQARPLAPASEAEDAARYRWVRNRLPGSAYRIAGVIYSEGGAGVDAAIDAARTVSLGRVG